MGCRKERLYQQYSQKYGPEIGTKIVDIALQNLIPCGYCRAVHAPGIDYLFEEESSNEVKR